MKLSLALALGATYALNPVTVKGNAFYNGSSDRFYIRGVDYQPGGSSNVSDPLSDADTCKRDLEYFTDLGINTIRVYTVDNSADHSECMTALEQAGIYVILDVNTPKQSLNRMSNESLQLSYNSGYLQHVFATIDAFKNYTNTLGFFAANEVINDVNNTNAAPYIKAVVRDMKAYIKAQSNRSIPVGYSAADISSNRWEQMTYLNCGDDDGARIDMFGMNDYSWCGASSYQQSGWATNVRNYNNYTIPLFLSEYGCNKVRPRAFGEVQSLYSDDMCAVYSGGLVYEYSNEANNYGLVNINGDSVSKLQDYDNFKTALSKASDPTGTAGAKSSSGPMSCPPFEDGVWAVEPNSPLPQMPKVAQTYLKNGAGKPLGLDGPDTQSGSDLDNPNKSSSSKSAASSTASSSTKADASKTTASAGNAAASASGSSSAASSSSSPSSSSSSSSKKSKNAGVITGPTVGFSAMLLGFLAYL